MFTTFGGLRRPAVTVLVLALVAAVLTTAAPLSLAPVAAQGSCSSSGRTLIVDQAGGPYRTIQSAVNAARTGDTVEVRAGDYRESVTIGRSCINLTARAGDTVYLTGSEGISSTQWEATGGRWRTTTTPAAGLDRRGGATWRDGYFSDVFLRDRPIAGHLAQVYVDGRELTQVETVGEVDGTTFHVDGSGRITIRDNPAGRYVEVSRRNMAVFFNNASGSTLSGFIIRRFATDNSKQGAIVVDRGSSNVGLRNLLVSDNSNAGAQILASGVTIECSTFEKNGRMGINGDRADNLRIERSLFANNNDEFFSTGAASAGVKITGTYGATFVDNRFEANHATALWVDVSSRWIDVLANTFSENDRYGVQIEVSAEALIASNHFEGGRRGIMIGESNNVQIWNNVIINAGVDGLDANSGEAIALVDGYRDAASGAINPDFAPPYRPGQNANSHDADAITWNVHDVTVRNNVLAESRRGQSNGRNNFAMLLVSDPQQRVAPDNMNLTIDHNHFYRDNPASNSSPKWVVGWGRGAADDTVAKWRSRGSGGTGSFESKFGLNLADGDDRGVALPSWIAGRLGVTTDDIGLARQPATNVGAGCVATSGSGTTGGGNTGGGNTGGGATGGGNTGGGNTGGSVLGSQTFRDVPAGAFYDEAVGWLASTNATMGTTPTTFDPNGIATRAELATILWRLAGQPTTDPPGSRTFGDVERGAFYDQAVGWLVAQEATEGTSPSTFSPHGIASRAELATFLWRLAGEQSTAAGSATFRDVAKGSFYDRAVGWLVATGATQGTTPTSFSPGGTATRAELATFLWRLDWGDELVTV